eukprot:UN31903
MNVALETLAAVRALKETKVYEDTPPQIRDVVNRKQTLNERRKTVKLLTWGTKSKGISSLTSPRKACDEQSSSSVGDILAITDGTNNMLPRSNTTPAQASSPRFGLASSPGLPSE